MCLAVAESELGDAGDALVQHDARSTDPVAVGLRTKVDNLEQAWASLVALKELMFDVGLGFIARVARCIFALHSPCNCQVVGSDP